MSQVNEVFILGSNNKLFNSQNIFDSIRNASTPFQIIEHQSAYYAFFLSFFTLRRRKFALGSPVEDFFYDVSSFQAVNNQNVLLTRVGRDIGKLRWKAWSNVLKERVSHFHLISNSLYFVNWDKRLYFSLLSSDGATAGNDNFIIDNMGEIQGIRLLTSDGTRNDGVYSLDQNRNLTLFTSTTNFTTKNAVSITTDVNAFQAINEDKVFVVKRDDSLWLYSKINGDYTSSHIENGVKKFKAVNTHKVFVLGFDNRLWLYKRPFSTLTRTHIRDNVVDFQPIKLKPRFVIYLNSQAISPSTYNEIINLSIGNLYINLAFILPTPNHQIALSGNLGNNLTFDSNVTAGIKKLKDNGIKIFVSFGGSTVTHEQYLYWAQRRNYETLGNILHDFVTTNRLDGIDIDFEDRRAFSTNKRYDGVEFLSNLTNHLFLLNSLRPITYAPEPPHLYTEEPGFCPGFRDVMNRVGDKISWLNVQFYNNPDYEPVNRSPAGIKQLLDMMIDGTNGFSPINPYKLLIGKPTTIKDQSSSGHLPQQQLVERVIEPFQKYLPELGGVMFWEFSKEATSSREFQERRAMFRQIASVLGL